MSFKSLGIGPALLEALTEQKYRAPYPVQSGVIPAVLNGKDVLGIAETGSGKTASYVLPILTDIRENTKRKNRHIDVLVLVPTRELAIQVEEVFLLFSKALPYRIKTLAVYGGVSINPQMLAVQGVQILVATPGRLLDLIDSNALHLAEVDTLVLDEADKMLNLGFKDEMSRIFSLLPAKRQNLLFSATLNEQLNGLKEVLLDDPKIIKIETNNNIITVINQLAYFVPEEKKGPLLRYLIKNKKLNQVLVFTSSIYQAENVANKLRKNGIDATPTHGKKSQTARREALHKFKTGRLKVLVATDLLSRGIDIEFLPLVINYELPRSPKDYIHRIGRTGRAESPGEAISFITADSIHHFKVIQKKMGTRVTLLNGDELDLRGF